VDNQEDIGRWNGRQIRNAFQIAASLAHYDLFEANEDPQASNKLLRGELNHTHFETVATATKEFDNYMAKARKGTDNELARRENTRDDKFVTTKALTVVEEVQAGNPQNQYASPHSQELAAHGTPYHHSGQRPAYPPQGPPQRSYGPPQAPGYYHPQASYYDYPEDSVAARRPPPDNYGPPPSWSQPERSPRQPHPSDAGHPMRFGAPQSPNSRYNGEAYVSEQRVEGTERPVRDPSGYGARPYTPVKASVPQNSDQTYQLHPSEQGHNEYADRGLQGGGGYNYPRNDAPGSSFPPRDHV